MSHKKNIFQFAFWFFALVLLSAVLAPHAYQLMPYFKFERILNRMLMFSFLIPLFIFVRLPSDWKHQFGLADIKGRFHEWLMGALGIFAVICTLTYLQVHLGAIRFKDDFIFSAALIASALLTGLVVGIFEEIFFRGFVFSKMVYRMHIASAVFLTNAFYAIVHFLKSGRPLIDETPDVWDSVRVIASSLSLSGSIQEIWPAFVGLFLFGIVLTVAYLRTRSLLLPMGVHAGAVFFIKLTSRWLEFDPSFPTLIYGGKGFYSGILGWAFILSAGFLVFLFFRPVKS